jgi:hypothetical protein
MPVLNNLRPLVRSLTRRTPAKRSPSAEALGRWTRLYFSLFDLHHRAACIGRRPLQAARDAQSKVGFAPIVIFMGGNEMRGTAAGNRVGCYHGRGVTGIIHPRAPIGASPDLSFMELVVLLWSPLSANRYIFL